MATIKLRNEDPPSYVKLKPGSIDTVKVRNYYRKIYILGVILLLVAMAAMFLIVIFFLDKGHNSSKFSSCNCNQTGFIKLDSNSCVLPIHDGNLPGSYQIANDIFNATGFKVSDYVNVTDINGNPWVIYSETLQKYVWKYKTDFFAFLLLTHDEHDNMIKILIDAAIGIISPSVLVDNADLYPILLERHCQNIDILISTHMHADHTGWFINTDNSDMDTITPSFTNARYIVSKTEYEYWSNQNESIQQNVRLNERFSPISDNDQLELRAEGDYFITPKVEIKNCSGHTAGHSCIVFHGDYQSKNQSYIFLGDLVHREIQISKPEIYPPFDVNPINAMNKRIEIIQFVHENDMIAFPSHFNGSINPGKIVECNTCFATNNLTWEPYKM